MSPARRGDPDKGKAAEQEQIEAQAAEAKEQTPAPAPDDAAADKPKPRRRRRSAKASKADAEPASVEGEDAAAEVKSPPADDADAEETAGAEEPAATEPAATEEPASEKPAPTRRRRSAAKTDDTDKPAAAPAPRRTRTAAPRRSVVHARARYVRTSARKARMVCGHLRGKSVEEARAILAFTPREVALVWSRLLESAVANAENNHELVGDDLIVREAYADEGPTIKRFRPRAMGRATPIRKRTSHLTITLTPKP